MNNHYRVHVYADPSFMKMRINVLRPCGKSQSERLLPDGTWRLVGDTEAMDNNDWLRIDFELAEALALELATATRYGKPSADRIEGELGATTKHLEDMRRLVFKDSE